MAHLDGAVKEAEMRAQTAQLDARPPSGEFRTALSWQLARWGGRGPSLPAPF
jgi:hypothetical protein